MCIRDRANVAQLQPAWVYHMKPAATAPADPAGEAPAQGRAGRGGRGAAGGFSSGETTPLVINGVMFRVRTGVPWRDLPERFGSWLTVYKRHRRWSADGTWQRLLTAVQAAQDAQGLIDWDVSVDSTTTRAHQHAAGAPRKAPPPVPAQKGEQAGTKRGDPVLASLSARLAEVVAQASA